jgi:Tfp pilus assembly protein PilF
MKPTRLAHTLLLIALAATAGCQSESTATPDGDYISIASDPTRDTETARKRTAEGTKLLQAGKYDLAEAELKAALAADLFHGPAHNNLGLVYLHQEKYYLAAWELQHAINLMPNQAEPRNNIGLVYEAVGQLDTAADWYAKALAIEPEAIQPLRHLVRTHIRQDRRDDETHELLKKLVLRETHPRWKTWARDQLAQW